MSYYKFYQPNDKGPKNQAGDCQIRALCKALDKTWLEVFDLIMPICRKYQAPNVFNGGSKYATRKIMQELGFGYTGISNKKGSKRPTVKSFTREHKNGSYVLVVANHVVASELPTP